MSNNKRKSNSLGLFLEQCTSFLKLFPLIDDKRVAGSAFFLKVIFISFCIYFVFALRQRLKTAGYFSAFSLYYFRQKHEG